MSDLFESLEQLSDPQQVLDQVVAGLASPRDHQKLFDALQMRTRLELGLPLLGKISVEDLDFDTRKALEASYQESCRRIGEQLLAAGDIVSAWPYVHLSKDYRGIREALEAWTPEQSGSAETLIQIAFGQGAHPVRGYELLVENGGTCEGVTVLEQQFPFSPRVRRDCVAVLVRHMHKELRHGIRQDLQRKKVSFDEQADLMTLVASHPVLFDEGACHVDDSHLQAVIRFSPSLTEADDLELVFELCDYGTRLASTMQHQEGPPFEDFYSDYHALMGALTGRDVDAAVARFGQKVDGLGGQGDHFAAEVLVFLLQRVGRPEAAIERFLKHGLERIQLRIAPPLHELCQAAGNYDVLETVARQQQNVLEFAAARIARRES